MEPKGMLGNQSFTNILVPLDGSTLAESVLPLTRLLAEKLGAKVFLLHIVEQRARAKVHGERHLTDTQEATAYLEMIAGRLGDKIEVEQHVHGTEEQDVAASIASHVQELHADLVALCTHGRNDPRRVMFGSIAQQVLKRVEAPVLLVRPQAPLPAQLGTLLVPLDGSSEGEYALPVAARLARALQSTLLLVRVVPTVGTVTGDISAATRLAPLASAATLDVEELQAQGYLARQVGELAQDGVRASAQVVRGDRVVGLAEAAARHGVDLTVMATHGRAGLDAIWIGSVAAGLINRLKLPLLLVKVQ